MPPAPAWCLRPLQENDVDAFVALYAAIFPEKHITRENLAGLCPAPPANSPTARAAMAPRESPATVWLLAPSSAGGEVVAFLYFWRLPGALEVLDIGVSVAWRRRGAGRFLVSALTETARNEGRCVLLEARASNTAAISLYERCGFVRDGVRQRYYGCKEDAVLLSWRRVWP